MLIAFLALLGVDPVVLLVFATFVLGRRRWVRSQAGALSCAIRVAQDENDGLGPTWHRGYGRWVRDVLVGRKRRSCSANDLMAADGVDGQRPAPQGEVKRLGNHPIVIRIKTGDAAVEGAAGGDGGSRLSGPYHAPLEAPVAADSSATAAADGASGPDRTT